MRWVRRILVAGVLIGVMVIGWRFAAENQEPVDVHYVAGQVVGIALWKVILGAFGAGAALVGAFTLVLSARNGLAHRRYRKALGGLESEIHQLRNLPLAPDSESNEPDPAARELPTGAAGRNP